MMPLVGCAIMAIAMAAWRVDSALAIRGIAET